MIDQYFIWFSIHFIHLPYLIISHPIHIILSYHPSFLHYILWNTKNPPRASIPLPPPSSSENNRTTPRYRCTESPNRPGKSSIASIMPEEDSIPSEKPSPSSQNNREKHRSPTRYPSCYSGIEALDRFSAWIVLTASASIIVRANDGKGEVIA